MTRAKLYFTDRDPEEIVSFDVDGSVGIGTTNPSQKLHVVGAGQFNSNGAVLNLVGTDHTYIQWYPDGIAAGRKGYIGYPTLSDDNLTIANEISTAGINFSANGLTRLSIDSSGRVTTPYQPSFAASHTNNTLVTGEIVWGTEHFDTGSNYSTSTGRFTAPVAGVYFFRAHTLVQNAAAGEARIAIYKNGAGLQGIRFITVKPANTWWSLICEGHLSLAVNDYVSIVIEQNPSSIYSDANYNSFSGHLIG